MAKLAAALDEAAALGQAEDRAFGSGCPSLLSKIKRGIAEVRKAPGLLDEQVPASAAAWSFLLRVAFEKPAFAKQVWDAASVLVEAPAWASSFATLEDKSRLNVGKAGPRDAQLVAGLVLRILSAGAAELGDLLPEENIGSVDPIVCATIVEGMQGDDFPAATAKAALSSQAGMVLAQRAADPDAGADKEKRRIVAPDAGKKAFGKGDDLPVYVCEGISGSHQNMEIKKGLV